MIAAIVGFLARQQTARPMARGGAECSVVGRIPAAIVGQAPTVSMGLLEGAGTTLTLQAGGARAKRSIAARMRAMTSGSRIVAMGSSLPWPQLGQVRMSMS